MKGNRMSDQNGLDPEMKHLELSRVQNGWMLASPSSFAREGRYMPLMVARTPRELADLVIAWAQQQADAPMKK
jgi:hypothetical protein